MQIRPTHGYLTSVCGSRFDVTGNFVGPRLAKRSVSLICRSFRHLLDLHVFHVVDLGTLQFGHSLIDTVGHDGSFASTDGESIPDG